MKKDKVSFYEDTLKEIWTPKIREQLKVNKLKKSIYKNKSDDEWDKFIDGLTNKEVLKMWEIYHIDECV